MGKRFNEVMLVMKKRVFSTLICGAIMVMSIAGCTSTTDTATDDTAAEQASTDSTITNSSVVASTENQQATADSSTISEEQNDNSELPVYIVADKNFYEMYEGDKTFNDPEMDYSDGVLFTGNLQIVMMSDEYADKYPGLYKTLKEKAEEVINGDDYAETIKYANEAYEEAVDGGYGFTGPFTSTYEHYIRRNDNTILSISCSYYDYEGGAHGYYGVFCDNYDVQTGNTLNLSDVMLISEEEFNKLLIDKLNEMAEEPDQYWDLEDTLSHYRYVPDESKQEDYENYEIGYNWYFAQDGLHIVFNPYDIAAYAYGSSEVVFNYDECSGIVDDKYILTGYQDYICSTYLPLMSSEYADDSYGTYLKYDPYEEAPEYGESIALVVNGKEAKFEEASLVVDSNAIKEYEIGTKDGRKYMYVTVPDANDYYVLYVFDITNEEPKAVDEMYFHDFYKELEGGYYGESALTDIHNMQLGSVFDMMGTCTAYGSYEVGSDGMPLLKSENYIIEWVSDEIYSKDEVQGVIVDEEGNVVDDDEIIGTGVHFAPYRTNGSSYIDCKLDDGRIIRLTYTTADYEFFINDKNVNDLFDGLTYAG